MMVQATLPLQDEVPLVLTTVVITKDTALRALIESMLKSNHKLIFFENIRNCLSYVYDDLPGLIIADIGHYEGEIVGALNMLKTDPFFASLPVIGLIDNDFIPPDFNQIFIDDYVRKNAVKSELPLTISFCTARQARAIETNPLTHLPGNISIIREIQRRLDGNTTFAIGWADLDNFKPFNDKYGFARGDEVIKMAGRLILNTIHDTEAKRSFLGHIGGDDFVFLTDYERAEPVASQIMNYFDQIISMFYDRQDRENNFIEGHDRADVLHRFPLLSISIGIAHNMVKSYHHYGEIIETASDLKKFAKQVQGSCYKIDRRKGPAA